MLRVHIYLDWLRTLSRKLIATMYFIAVTIAVIALDVQLTSAELTNQSVTSTVSVQKEKLALPRDDTTVATPTAKPVTAPTPPIQQTASQPAPAYDKVSIPSIGLSSQLVTVGLTNTNAIDVHESLVGWWNGSARPGSNGAAFLDGHNPGIFKNLQNITVGAKITISLVSGQSYTYTVVHREVVPLVGIDMKKALTPYANAKQGLNLMTCVGTYNPATGTTDQRLVVYATR